MGDAPDTSGQNEAALMQAQLSREQLDWAREIYAENAPAREAAAQRANELSDLQMEYMRQAMSQSNAEQERYNRLYAPLEDSLVQDAKDYDTESRRESEAGKAITDVRSQFQAARTQQDAELKSMGVNPSDGRYANMASQQTTQQALAEASAANQARTNVETQAWARKMDAAGLGKGVVSNQATQANLATQSGNSALGAATTGLQALSSGNADMNAAYSGARQGWSNAASIYGNIAATEAQSSSSGISAALGAAGTIAGAVIV